MSKRAATGPTPPIWTLPPPPPRRRQIGRDEVVAAAVAEADGTGAAPTMKAVAARLGPYSPMALYRYVHNKDGLIDLMLDAVTAQVPVPERPGPDWRADLRDLAGHTRRMTARHPWYATLAHARAPAGPHQMRRLEFMLAVLVARGATVTDAMTYAALIDRHILGSAQQDAEEADADRRHGLTGDDGAALHAAIAPVRELAVRGRHPHLADWLAHPAGPSADDRFEMGLTFLLEGIAARLPANP